MITEVKMPHTPGMLIDHMSDGGVTLERFRHIWPETLPIPHGRPSGDAYVATVDTGHEKRASYPISSPEEALASSLYFFMYGAERLADQPEQMRKIAETLKEARVYYGVQEYMTPGAVQLIKQAHLSRAQEPPRVFLSADAEGHLPMEHPVSFEKSASLFVEHAGRWDHRHQATIIANLYKGAEHHGLGFESDVPSSEHWKVASSFDYQIDRRKKILEHMTNHPNLEFGLSLYDNLKEASSDTPILDLIELLEEADRANYLDGSWNKHFLDPMRTVLVEHGQTDKKAELIQRTDQSKSATARYNRIDFDKLASDGAISEDVLESLREAPELVENMPPSIRAYIMQFAR